ncbi:MULTISPECIES: ATP-dependent nuclease [Nostoc]|uniref:ATP-binding protein n=1 Tax=Nostoc sphaeroides CCNUC1 TaxID=2653204 RepID=A0A5P8WGS3_9NOSO|nr:ATP-binding protein [Nostoc sphaeroides]QFS51894.1 ATP-binding protein [Nostoc sphaeroides CCNUC1]
MNSLQSVRIQRFKRIEDAFFDLDSINVLVGANNSGKSSIIQGLHFAIGVLQSVKLSNGNIRRGSSTLSPTQLIYSPSDSVYSLGKGGELRTDEAQGIAVKFTLTSGDSCEINIRRGRNRNISVAVDSMETAEKISDLKTPFSIFSPGLAGIAKNETYLSDGVLLRTLARGDANLVLRNILLRLWEKPEWNNFIQDLHEVFPETNIRVNFLPETDEHIQVMISTDSGEVPIELAGTGVLQAAQILSYIHRFSPRLIVLDEPDSHLHPNNQRLLCKLLRTIAEERDTQVLLTTHSRHVVDALGSSVRFLWVRNATVETATQDDELGVLLDIGALDIRERIAHDRAAKVVVLTEDENIRILESILESSGFKMDYTLILPYYGVTAIKNLRPLINIVKSSNESAKILLHRDRDFLSNSETISWQQQVRQLQVEPFLTFGTNVESYLVNAKHLALLNNEVSEKEFETMLEEVIKSFYEDIVGAYVNGRIEIERQNGNGRQVDYGKLAAKAPLEISNNIPQLCHGKILIRGIRAAFREKYKRNLNDIKISKYLAVEELQVFARKAF